MLSCIAVGPGYSNLICAKPKSEKERDSRRVADAGRRPVPSEWVDDRLSANTMEEEEGKAGKVT